MSTKLTVRKNWITSLELMAKKPIVMLPFLTIAFLEGLTLELIYFSPRKPISLIAAPIIRKFFGELYVHYPFNLEKLPKLFYYSQTLIYIFAGVFLVAISINIVKNIKEGLPLKANALIKNAARRYLSFFFFGVIIVALMFLLRRLDIFAFSKLEPLVTEYLPRVPQRLLSLGFVVTLFFLNIIMETFLILTLPIIVIKKKSLPKALLNSIALGFRNFFKIFVLIFLPFLIYLPISLLKSYPAQVANKTSPEMNLLIIAAGIVIAVLAECFMTVCVTQFLLEKIKPPANNMGHKVTRL